MQEEEGVFVNYNSRQRRERSLKLKEGTGKDEKVEIIRVRSKSMHCELLGETRYYKSHK